MEASLTCAVCLSVFESPVTLPVCSHNFCKKCILECVTRSLSGQDWSSAGDGNIWSNSQLECPLCRKNNFIPEGAANLSVNTTLLEVVKIFRGQRDGGCGSAHGVCLLEEGEVEEEEDGLRSGSPAGGQGGAGLRALCSKHSHRDMQLFCKVCKLAACGQCVSEEHTGVFHSVNLVDVTYQEEKLAFFNNLKELRQLNDRMKTEISDNPSVKENILEYEEEMVKTKFDQILKRVQLKKEKLLDGIQKEKEWKWCERKARLERRRSQQRTVVEQLQECEKLVNECNPINFLMVACNLNERVKSNLAVMPSFKKCGEFAGPAPRQFLITPLLDSISELELTEIKEPTWNSDTDHSAGKHHTDGYKFKKLLKIWKQPKDGTHVEFQELRYNHYHSCRKDWNCFVSEKLVDTENLAASAVSSSDNSKDFFKKYDSAKQSGTRQFRVGRCVKKVCDQATGNSDLHLSLDSEFPMRDSKTSTPLGLNKLFSAPEQKLDLTPSILDDSEKITSISSSLETIKVTESLPITLSAMSLTKTELPSSISKSEDSNNSGFSLPPWAAPPGQVSKPRDFWLSDWSNESSFRFGMAANSTSANKVANQQTLPAVAGFSFGKCEKKESATSNATGILTSETHSQTACDASIKSTKVQIDEESGKKSSIATSAQPADSLITAPIFYFGSEINKSSLKTGPCKFGPPVSTFYKCKQAQVFSVATPCNSESMMDPNPFSMLALKLAATGSTDATNRESSAPVSESDAAKEESKDLKLTQKFESGTFNLKENKSVSSISVSSPPSKLEEGAGDVTTTVSSIASASTIAFSSPSSSLLSTLPGFSSYFLPTPSSLIPLPLFTSFAVSPFVFSTTNSTGSSQVDSCEGHSLTKQHSSSIATAGNVVKPKIASISEVPLIPQTSTVSRADSARSNHVVITANFSNSSVASPQFATSAKNPLVLPAASSTISNHMAFTSVNPSKDLSSACQQPNSVAPNPDAKPKEASTFEVPLTGQSLVSEIKSFSSLQPCSTASLFLGNPFEGSANGSDKEGTAFGDQICGMKAPRSSEDEKDPACYLSNVNTSSNVSCLEAAAKSFVKENAFINPKAFTSAQDSLSHAGQSPLVLPSAASVSSDSSSLVEVQNDGPKDEAAQKTITAGSPLASPVVHRPLFNFGTEGVFQFKLDLNKPVNVSESNASDTGNCKRESQEMLPSCPPVNHSSEMEDQDVLFSNRAKLYQFDRPTSQWKERAVGEMKVFQHKRKKISRVVMWSSVNKCCANHWITRNLQLRQIKNRFDSWAWRTLDFSEEKSMVLDLAVRFQLKETALAFKNVFENVQSTVEVCHLPEARLNCSGVNGKSDPNVNNLGDLSEIDQVAIQEDEEEAVGDAVIVKEIEPIPEQTPLATELHFPAAFCSDSKPAHHSSEEEEQDLSLKEDSR
eukprot:gi/632948558/ref/XP_007889662.1/ PREDICTED: E3 SUMO-protein ligase RanBP2-like isoform X2 [Callorhinchus milii]